MKSLVTANTVYGAWYEASKKALPSRIPCAGTM